MATTQPSDAVIVPQDPGTGIGSADDIVDAAASSLLASHEQGEYVHSGLGFSNVDTGNDQVDIGKGVCYITDTSTSTTSSRGSGGNPQIHSTSGSGFDTEVPTDPVMVVILPSDITNLDLDSSTVNDIYIAADPTSQNSVTVEGTSGGAPSDPHLKIGTVDTSSGDTTRAADDPSVTYDSVQTDKASIGGAVATPDPADGISGIETAIRNNASARDLLLILSGEYKEDYAIAIKGADLPDKLTVLAFGATIVQQGTGTTFHHDCSDGNYQTLNWFGGTIDATASNPSIGLHAEDTNSVQIRHLDVRGPTGTCIKLENTTRWIDAPTLEHLKLNGGDGVLFERAAGGESGTASFQNASVKQIDWFDDYGQGYGLNLDGGFPNSDFRLLRSRVSTHNSSLIRVADGANFRNGTTFSQLHFEQDQALTDAGNTESMLYLDDATSIFDVLTLYGYFLGPDVALASNPNNITIRETWKDHWNQGPAGNWYRTMHIDDFNDLYVEGKGGTWLQLLSNGNIRADVRDGNALEAYRGFFRVNTGGYGLGVATAEDLSGKSGNYVGEMRLDDGTNTANGGLYCHWTGSAWQPSDGSATFT